MQWEQIIAFWGAENLKRWPEDSVREVSIPESSKAFLAQVGMPFREKWTLRFDPADCQLPRLPNHIYYRRLGFDDVVPICLDEQADGNVVALEREVGGTERYINSGVEAFGECLVYYQQYRQAVRGISGLDQIEKLIAAGESIYQTDPSAFEHPDNWWPLILEEMHQGLL